MSPAIETFLQSSESLYATNQLCNVAYAAYYAYSSYYDPKFTHIQNLVAHTFQALLRQDGYFGVKIDSLKTDIKFCSPDARLYVDLAVFKQVFDMIADKTNSIPRVLMLGQVLNFGINTRVRPPLFSC